MPLTLLQRKNRRKLLKYKRWLKRHNNNRFNLLRIK